MEKAEKDRRPVKQQDVKQAAGRILNWETGYFNPSLPDLHQQTSLSQSSWTKLNLTKKLSSLYKIVAAYTKQNEDLKAVLQVNQFLVNPSLSGLRTQHGSWH